MILTFNINLYCDYVNDVYNINKINKLISEYMEECTEIVAYSQLRWWGYSSKLEGYANYKSNYLKALDSLSNFFEQRPKYTLQHMKDYLGLKGNLVDLNIEVRGKGKVQINTIIPVLNNGKWSGKYFSRIPISINAIPDIGYNFRGWSGYIDSIQQNNEIILFDSQTIVALFD